MRQHGIVVHRMERSALRCVLWGFRDLRLANICCYAQEEVLLVWDGKLARVF